MLLISRPNTILGEACCFGLRGSVGGVYGCE
jgi:hypothetical protein